MNQGQIERFRAWFDEYVAGFYGDDEYVNANIKLKDEHSRRVCDEMMYLADELGLDENQRAMAEVMALFHDIGRFEQFIKYRTYNDPRSINHCLLGVEVLRKTNILDGVQGVEKDLIEKAIEYHGLRELPGNLDGDCLLFSRILRDADKLDIFYVVNCYYDEYDQNPDAFRIELELPDEPWYSQDVLRLVLDGEKMDYHILKTWNDMKLCQLSWVYDVNYTAALRRIRERKYIEKIIGHLPDNEEIRRAKEVVLNYMNGRIAEGR
jgi:putative nucleotidyltransferase with HDIG domain